MYLSPQKDETKGEIYVAFNTSHLPVVVGLPPRPGFRWEPVVDRQGGTVRLPH